MNHAISALRRAFFGAAEETSVEMSRLNSSRDTTGVGQRREPRASFSLGKWFSTLSLRFWSPQPAKPSTPRAGMKPEKEVKSFAEVQQQAQAQRSARVHASAKVPARPSLEMVATARFEKTLDHLYKAASSPAHAQQQLSKAIKAFQSFKELIDQAPDKEQALARSVRKTLGSAQSMKNAQLLLLLQPGKIFHQHLPSDELRSFLDAVAVKGSRAFDAAPCFRP